MTRPRVEEAQDALDALSGLLADMGITSWCGNDECPCATPGLPDMVLDIAKLIGEMDDELKREVMSTGWEPSGDQEYDEIEFLIDNDPIELARRLRQQQTYTARLTAALKVEWGLEADDDDGFLARLVES